MKKKISVCFILTAAVFLTAAGNQPAAYAAEQAEVSQEVIVVEEAPATAAPADRGLIKNFDFGFGLEIIADYNYHESHFMRLDGGQFGFYVSGMYTGFDPVFPELYFSFVGGDIEYDGGYQSGGTLTGDVGNFILNLRPLLGIDVAEFLKLSDPTIKPYSGLCYRYCFNNLEDLGTGGYKRHQHYLYLPLGLELALPLKMAPGVTLGAKTEFDILILGKNKSGDHNFTQKSGWGLRFAPNLRFDVSEQFALVGEVYYQYWKISESDTVDGYREPENSTREYGLKAGVIL